MKKLLVLLVAFAMVATAVPAVLGETDPYTMGQHRKITLYLTQLLLK
jgi:hypothetical protein